MSMSISSYESDVAYDEGNLFDMTIDATSTACLNIVDFMMKGSNFGTKNSNMMESWLKAFDCLVVDSFELERARTKERLSEMKRNYTHNPAREHKRRVNKNAIKPRFNPNISESCEDNLADQSVELDQSTLSASMEADYVDQSGEFEYSAYDSEETSFDEGSSGFQSYESDDDYLSESLDETDILPNRTKIRRRTVISITQAGRCVDQIDMGALVNSSAEKRHDPCDQLNTCDVESRSSPSSSILRIYEDLERKTCADALSSGRFKGGSLVYISRNLFSDDAVPIGGTNNSLRNYGLGRKSVPITSVDLLWWFSNQGISNDFPVQFVPHRLNVLSRYNPFSYLFHTLIASIAKGLEIVKNDDSIHLEDNLNHGQLPPVTFIYSDDAACELSLTGDQGNLSAPSVLRRDIYAYLEAISDDMSTDSDLTPKCRHPKRVSWSPQLSCQFPA